MGNLTLKKIQITSIPHDLSSTFVRPHDGISAGGILSLIASSFLLKTLHFLESLSVEP